MMSVAKECGEFHMLLNENPRGARLWGFLVRYGEPLRLGCCCLFISVQPFTNVVANYACQYRDKESYYVLHRVSPPFCWRFDSIFILPYLPTGFYRFRIFSLLRRRNKHPA